MTIAVCLKVMDGIILAADSASTLGGPDGIANVYDNANKVVNLRKGLPIGINVLGARRDRIIVDDDAREGRARPVQ